MAGKDGVKKRPGRPATGIGLPLTVRLDPETLERLDAWRAEQPNEISRPEAIRRLTLSGLEREKKRTAGP